VPSESSKPSETSGPTPASQGSSERRSHVPADIRNVSFPVSVRGYDRRAVDAYVNRVNRVIAELEVSRSPQAAVRHAVDRVTEQTKAILQEARDSGERITATARDEGDQILAEAKAEAAELVVNASSEADRLGVEADQALAAARAEAEGLLARARKESEDIVAKARSEAAEIRRTSEEELEALRTEAEARMRELKADTEAVWNERRELLGDIHGMASRLQDAASAAAARFTPEDEKPAAATDDAPDGPTPPADSEAPTVIATSDSQKGSSRSSRTRKPARQRH
jgi:DivIVA domain-containing protein